MQFKCSLKGKYCDNADALGECIIGRENCNDGKPIYSKGVKFPNENILSLWDDFDFDADEDLW